MRSNLPDDWGMYYSRCSVCGKRYHLSGCEPCDCEEAAPEDVPDAEETIDDGGEG